MKEAGGIENVQEDGSVGYYYPPPDQEPSWTPPVLIPSPKYPDNLASPERRDTAYNLLLAIADISERHKLHLLNERMLPKNEIINFATLYNDSDWRLMVSDQMASLMKLDGVPGFYKTREGDWSIGSPVGEGILVPVRDYNGLIQGMQVRLDSPLDGQKYKWLSSNPSLRDSSGYQVYRAGTSALSLPHFAQFRMSPTIWITEGPLKAHIAATLTGEVFIGFPGAHVGSLDIMQQVRLRVGENFVLAPDADIGDNIHVWNGWYTGCENLIEKCGAKVRFAVWDRADGKGIDDVIIKTGKLPSTVSAKRFFEMYPEEQVKEAWEERKRRKNAIQLEK